MAPKQRGQFHVDASYLTAGPAVVLAAGSVAPPPAPPQRVIFEARTPAQANLFFEMMKDNMPSYQEYKRKKAKEESDQKGPEKGSSRFNKIISSSSGSSGYVPAPKRAPPVRVDPLEQQQRFERQQMSEEDDSKGNIEDLYGSIESEAVTDPWFRTNNNNSSSRSSSNTGDRCYS